MSSSGGASRNGLLTASAHLTTAALKTLFSAPTPIVVAVGTGRALMVSETVAEYVPGTGSLAVSGNAGIFVGTGNPVIDGLVDSAIGQLDALSGFTPAVHQLVHGAGLGLSAAAPKILSSLADNAPLVVGSTTGDPQQVGPITALTITAAGTGYAVNDTGTIAADQYTGGATYRVTSVAAVTGAVTGLAITAAGDGYGVGTTDATATGGAQPGVGTNLTITPTAVTFAGDLYVTVTYQTLTLH